MFGHALIRKLSLPLLGVVVLAGAMSARAQSRIEFSSSREPSRNIETAPENIGTPGLFDRRSSSDSGSRALSTPPPNSGSQLSRSQRRELERIRDQQKNWIFMTPDAESGNESNAPEEEDLFGSGGDAERTLIESFILGEERNQSRNDSQPNSLDSSGRVFGGDDSFGADNAQSGFFLSGEQGALSPVDQFLQNQTTRPLSDGTGYSTLFDAVNGGTRQDYFETAGAGNGFGASSFDRSGPRDAVTSGRSENSGLAGTRRSIDTIIERDRLTDQSMDRILGGNSFISSVTDATREPLNPISPGGNSLDGLNIFDSIANSSVGNPGSSPDLSGGSVLDRIPSFGQSALPLERSASAPEASRSNVRSLFQQPRQLQIPGSGF